MTLIQRAYSKIHIGLLEDRYGPYGIEAIGDVNITRPPYIIIRPDCIHSSMYDTDDHIVAYQSVSRSRAFDDTSESQIIRFIRDVRGVVEGIHPDIRW